MWMALVTIQTNITPYRFSLWRLIVTCSGPNKSTPEWVNGLVCGESLDSGSCPINGTSIFDAKFLHFWHILFADLMALLAFIIQYR
jgi:hypothetical protein